MNSHAGDTRQQQHPAQQYDVAVIGAGSAGLQAALTLGRMRRSVVVFSTDRFRNDPALHMQNFLGHDGAPPAELRLAARRDIGRYDTVEFVERAVTAISGEPDAFTVVAHCPHCHGYEFADRRVGLLGAGPHIGMLAQLMSRLASRIVVLTNGAQPEPEVGLRAMLDQGHAVELGGMFVAPTGRQSAPFAAQLGLETGDLGGVHVDIMGATSRPGVYAAGDLAHHRDLPMPMASVLTAAAAGLVAAAACDRDLMAAELAVARG